MYIYLAPEINHHHPSQQLSNGGKGIDNTTTFTATNKTPSFEFSQFSSRGEGRGTNLDEVEWLIANLKENITQQSSIIENVRAYGNQNQTI